MLARARPSGEGRIVGLLDIGAGKVCCMIASLSPPAEGANSATVRLLGFGHQRSRGVKAGVVVDLEETVRAVQAAVGAAERMAGLSIDDVYLVVMAGRLKSSLFSAAVQVDRGVVEDEHVARVLAGGEAYLARAGRAIIQHDCVGFRLDGSTNVRDPRGLAGAKLVADLHAVTADEAPLRNLVLAAERCHLTVVGMLSAPAASGLATSTADERELGVVVVDMGAGTTSLAAWSHGRLRHIDVALVGGQHATFDLANALGAPLDEAERIKTRLGTLIAAQSDEREQVSFPLAGNDGLVGPGEGMATRADVRRIIAPRFTRILRDLGQRIAQHPEARAAASRIVLTGGASHLPGLPECAADILDKPVRIGRPMCAGLPATACQPQFAALIGLLVALAATPCDGDPMLRAYRDRNVLTGGYIGRLKEWVIGNF
ncbi:MAG TPA: cell division protein FtsA [Hyphomicrobiaceae bacterium]|nr:cell division protein FtsA [Hyphomicrobiaceae bacterium]